MPNPLFEPTRSGAAQIGLHFILGQFAPRLRGRLNSTLDLAGTFRVLQELQMHRAIFFALVLVGGSSNAALELRGRNMVYDTSSNLTWARTVTLAAGSIFDDGASTTDGRLTYNAAQAWVQQLNVLNTESGSEVTGWRLPAVRDLGALGCDPAYASSPNVGLDCGYVGTSAGASELAILIHGSLGNPPRFVPVNSGPFASIPLGFAWLGLSYQPSTADIFGTNILTVEGYLVREPNVVWPPALAWGFALSEGFQGPAISNSEGYAWAVRAGDVSSVPELNTASMLIFGSLAVLFLKRNSARRGKV